MGPSRSGTSTKVSGRLPIIVVVLRSEREPKRHMADKRKVWEDIQEVIRVLTGEINPRPGSGASAGSPDLFG